jgi:ABC-type uncharacterized transport system auxiliary subunit
MRAPSAISHAGLAALLAAVCAGCASGPAEPDHFYRLSVAAPSRLSAPKLAGVLEVDRLRVEEIAHGRRLLYRDGRHAVAIGHHSYHYWSDPPGLMLQYQLVHFLRAANVAQSVVTPGIHVASDYILAGRVVRLERRTGPAPSITVELEFSLLREQGRALLLQKTYFEERPVPSESVADSVTVYQEAVTAIFQQLLADIPNR